MSIGYAGRNDTTSPASPATPLEAGFRRARVTVPADDVTRLRADLTEVLGGVIAGWDGAGGHSERDGRDGAGDSAEAVMDRAERGVLAVLPAILAQHGLRELLADGGENWDGLIHRRCRIEAAAGPEVGKPGVRSGGAWSPEPEVDEAEPGDVGRGPARCGAVGLRAAGARDGSDSGRMPTDGCSRWAADVVVTSWIDQRTTRGGWVFMRTCTRVEAVGQAAPSAHTWLVIDELAHRLDRSHAPTASISRSNGVDLALHLCRSRSGGGAAGQGNVARWGRASGDLNPIHLVRGSAQAAGLAAGNGVVLHGLMLGALSAALGPPGPRTGRDRRACELRLLAPVVVEEDRETDIAVDPVTGDVVSGGRAVARWM